MSQKNTGVTAVLKNPKTCTVDGCDREKVAHGLCHGHYKRIGRHKGQWASPLLRPYVRKK